VVVITNRNRKVELGFAAAIFLLALLLRLLFLADFRHSPYFDNLMIDAASYDRWAQDIAAGDGAGDQVYYQAPLYPYFLGAMYSIFGRDLMSVRIVQALIGSLTCVLIMLFTTRLFTRRVGVAAGVIAALYSTLIFQDLMILKSVIVFPFLAAALLRFSQAVEGKRTVPYLQSGILFGIAVCGRGNLLFGLPLFFIWIIFRDKNQINRRALTRGLFFLLGAAIAISPVTARNRIVAGDWVLTESDAGINLFVGNNPAATGIHTPPANVRTVPEHEESDARKFAEMTLGKSLKPSEVSSFWIGKAVHFALSNPAEEIKLILRKLRLTMSAYEVPDNYNQYYFGRVSPLFRGFLPSFLWISPFAVIGFVTGLRRWRTIGFLHLYVLAYLFSLLAFYITSRYRLPIVIGLIPFAAAGFFHFVDQFRCRQWRRLIAPSSTVAVMIAFGVPSLATHDGFSKQETEIATFYAMKMDFTNADAAFKRAVAEAAGSRGDLPFIYLNQARFYSSFGMIDEAKDAYQNALQAAPGFTPARRELDRLESIRSITD